MTEKIKNSIFIWGLKEGTYSCMNIFVSIKLFHEVSLTPADPSWVNTLVPTLLLECSLYLESPKTVFTLMLLCKNEP